MSTWMISDELYHHGIKGQKWGIRRYQNEDGSLTPEGIKRYGYDASTGKISEKGMVRKLRDAIKTTKRQYKEEGKNPLRDADRAFFKGELGKQQRIQKEYRERVMKNYSGNKIDEKEFNLAVAKADYNDKKAMLIGSSISTAIIGSGMGAYVIGTAKDTSGSGILTKGLAVGYAGLHGAATALSYNNYHNAGKNLEKARDDYNKKKGGR